MPIPGREVIVYVTIAGSPVAVGEQTDFSTNATASTTTIGHKLSSVKSVIASSTEMTLTLNALALYSDQGQQHLESAFRQKSSVTLVEMFEGNPQWEYRCKVTGISKSHPEEGASTLSVNFTVDGDPIPV